MTLRTPNCRPLLSGLRLSFLLLTSLGAAAQPKRVLIVHSFVKAAPPFTTHSIAFETTLTSGMGERVDLDEVTLDVARYATPDMEEALVEYLRKRQEKWQPDLVVPIGSPAGVFVAEYRDRLFPMTPVLYTGMDRRRLPPDALRTNATFVGESFDLPGMVEDILQVSPATTNIAVVIGASQLERYWATAIQSEWLPFTNRVSFTWLNDLSFDQMLGRVSTLPPRSFIFVVLLMRDASGVTHNADEALTRIHAVANAPVNSIFQHQLGLGIVGGRLYPAELEGEESARIAIRILRGEPATNFPPKIIGPLGPRYNQRELRRWNISEARLPSGSVILFRQPGFWELYWWPIAGTLGFISFQTVLIAGLVINRSRRRQGVRGATLIADVSSKFINLPPDEVDHEILEAQRRIFELLHLDVSGFWQWSAEGSGFFRLTHFSRAGAGSQIPERMNSQEYFPWYQQQVLAGRTIAVRSMTELPPEAARDRETFRQFGVKSNLTIPLSVGGEAPIGALGFTTTRAEREWPDALVQRLQLVAQIFANALARKRADQALRESEARFRTVADTAPVLIWMAGADKRCTFVNKSWLDFTGRALEQELGESWAEGIHPDDRAGSLKIYVEAFDARQSFTMDYRLRRHDGEYRWFSDHGVPQYDSEGTFLGYIGSCLDITERKRAEEAMRILAHASRVSTMGALAGSLAHELNQPLTAILSNAQAGWRFLADATPDVAEIREVLQDIARDTKRAGEVIRQMRTLIKKEDLRFDELGLNQLIQDVVRLLHSDTVIRKVQTVLDFHNDLPKVSGDAVQLQQVMLNLLLNAFDAMKEVPESERTVCVRTRPADAGAVQIEVSDRGTGINPERLARLFEPFQTTKQEGLGLGLAISRSIVEAHGGRLWATNNADRGATFYFTVPLFSTPPHSRVGRA